MQHFNNLREEINFQKEILNKERDFERKEFEDNKDNNNILKSCVLEDSRFLAGNTWRLLFRHQTPIKNQKWIRRGSPVLIESDLDKIFGNVYTWNEKEINIQIRGDYELESETYVIKEWFQESTYEMYFDVINRLENQKDNDAYQKLAWILGYNSSEKTTPPKMKSEVSPKDSLLQLNDYGFVFGPPGTGKTTLLIQIIEELRTQKTSVLVLCPTNFACDYIVELAISKKLNVIRLGNSTKIKDNVLNYHIDHLISESPEQKQIQTWHSELKGIQKKANTWKRSFGKEEREERKNLRREAKDLLKIIRGLESNIRTNLIDQCDLLVSTFSGYANELKKGRRFKYVFIDEATQGLDVACYMGVLAGEKVFFLGDPKQLPPSYSHPDHKTMLSFLEKGILNDDGSRIIFLNKQFRMKPEILNFPNENFYEGKIETPNLIKESKLQKEEFGFDNLFGSDCGLIWFDTAGSDTMEISGSEEMSYRNEIEISLIERLFELGLSKRFTNILSPYRGQVEALRDKNIENLNVQTIDSFQGRESEIILISLVRSNETGEIGFLSDFKRLNVALTRAKYHLIIIGDSGTLCQNHLYQKLYNTVEKMGDIRSIYEFME
ncbi:MAG: AAA domain-containing protein [Leptospira sp.]|nr:AAA domain-containing protein [Leptospira sp.]